MLKRLLIAQNQLSEYGGSEIITLEVAEEALRNGFRVDILTNYFGLPFSNEISPEITVIGTDQHIDISEYSHIWIHHSLIPKEVIDRLLESKGEIPAMAFHHMSMYVPVEYPIFFELEDMVAHKIYCNSPETQESFEQKGLDSDKFEVFGNPAPDSFQRNISVTPRSDKLENIIVVSNHIPEEITKATEHLKKQGANVDIYGSSNKVGRVTPELLHKYDLVITIGKTVQYSLVSGIPVYCYDHFGGSGYLSQDNFEKNRFYNFSGRGFKRKSATTISKEIVSGYKKACNQAAELKNLYTEEFLLSKKLENFFNTKPYLLKDTSRVDKKVLYSAQNASQLIQKYFRDIVYYREKQRAIEVHSEELAQKVEQLTQKTEMLQKENEKINKIILPLKKIKHATPKKVYAKTKRMFYKP